MGRIRIVGIREYTPGGRDQPLSLSLRCVCLLIALEEGNHLTSEIRMIELLSNIYGYQASQS